MGFRVEELRLRVEELGLRVQRTCVTAPGGEEDTGSVVPLQSAGTAHVHSPTHLGVWFRDQGLRLMHGGPLGWHTSTPTRTCVCGLRFRH